MAIAYSSNRFSELLTDSSLLRSSTQLTTNAAHDSDAYQSVVYTMATCHSLRVVDGELLGDPLDVKMFQFTGWSYQEGGTHDSEQPSPKFDTITPSIARPPPSPETGNAQVNTFFSLFNRHEDLNGACLSPARGMVWTLLIVVFRPTLNSESSGALNSSPSSAVPVSLSENLVRMA